MAFRCLFRRPPPRSSATWVFMKRSKEPTTLEFKSLESGVFERCEEESAGVIVMVRLLSIFWSWSFWISFNKRGALVLRRIEDVSVILTISQLPRHQGHLSPKPFMNLHARQT